MPKYRYILADLLTNEIINELPFYSVTWDRLLSAAGNFQGFLQMPMNGIRSKDVIQCTVPGHTALYIERDAQLVWGGILWARTWQESSKSIQLNGQTFESYAGAVDVRTTLSYFDTDQRNILIDLWLQLQTDQPFRNIGVTIPSNFSVPNFRRTIFFNDYQTMKFAEAIDNLLQYENAPDYYIDVAYDSSGTPTKTLRVDDVLGQSLANTGLGFDFPGGIKDFWIPESASNGLTTAIGLGAGSGVAQLKTVDINQALLDEGYPDIVQVYTNTDTQIDTDLSSQLRNFRDKNAVPLSVPTFDTNPDQEPKFGSYALGDEGNFTMVSERWAEYPNNTRTMSTRVVGWNVTPPNGSSTELVKIVIDGESLDG